MYHSLYSTANVIGEGNAEPPAVCYHSNRYPDVIHRGVGAIPDAALTENQEGVDILLADLKHQ